MKKILLILGLVSTILFVSCKKDVESTTTEETQKSAQPFSGETWLKQRMGTKSQPQTSQPQSQQAVQNQQTTTTAPGMNPPHGQPGHRCEIPVGAPLNSKPAQNAQAQKPTPVVSPKPVEKPVMNVNSNSGSATIVGMSTPPGINPPHGQEGHRCDIAVGAPLPKE